MKVIFPLLLLLSVAGQAAPDSLRVIELLDTEWMVYRDSTYRPFVPGISSGNPRALHLLIDPDQPDGTRLRVSLPQGSVLMSNQQVMQVYDRAQTAHIPLDSLAQYLNNGSIWVTIFNNQASLQRVSASLVRKNPAAAGKTAKNFVARSSGVLENFLVVSVLMLVVMLALIRNLYFREFNAAFNPFYIFSARTRKSVISSIRLLSINNVALLLFYSLMLGFVFLMLSYFSGMLNVTFTSRPSVMAYMRLWMQITGVIVLFILAKIIVTRALETLFGHNGMMRNHITGYYQVTLFFTLLAFLVVSGYYFSSFHENSYLYDVIIYSSLIFVCLRVIFLYVILLDSSTINKSYLFFYICGAEIVPLVVGIKVLIVS